ncbi:MAG: histidine ammonia-lyase [Planctomycetota bacterium]|jgi:histidine ammonia-lyase
MPIFLNGKDLTIDEVVRVARDGEEVGLDPEAIERIKKCRAMLDEKVQNHEIMYGVTTGIGELSEVVLTREQTQDFQKFLIYSHAAGCGEPIPEDGVRAAMTSRLNVHCNGRSGLRPEVSQTVVNMLNKGVTPVVCQRGSVGACGDLSPMAQMAMVPMGEGEAFYRDERLPAAQAMERAGIPIVTYKERDGLAMINGANMTAGMGCLQIEDAARWYKHAQIAAAMSMEALNTNMLCCDERLHKARGYPGAVACASNLRRLVEGSEMLQGIGKKKVQDAYSLRSTPQVIGSALDALNWTRRMFSIELNGVGDNPLFFPDEDEVVTGANFQGTPLAFGLEMLGMGVTTIAVLSERRLNRLMNPALNVGLPAYLTKGAGMMSGLMLTQYTAGSLVCENRILSHPAATGSIPAAADQEDFVSMSMTTAIKTRQIIENAHFVLAIEFMAGAQAFDFRSPLKPSPASKKVYDIIRKYVDFLDDDRALFDDINRLTEVVKSGEIVEAIEKEIGPLEESELAVACERYAF